MNTENDYVIVRTYSAGVFFGVIKSRNGKEVVLTDARRIYYWEGAATLSQLAVDGTKEPLRCKFPVPVKSIILTEVIEILSMTDDALKSLQGVKIWKA